MEPTKGLRQGQPVSAEAAAIPKPLTWLRRVAAVFPLAKLLPLRMLGGRSPSSSLSPTLHWPIRCTAQRTRRSLAGARSLWRLARRKAGCRRDVCVLTERSCAFTVNDPCHA